MFNIKKLIQALMLFGLSATAFATPLGATAFSIAPLTTNTTVQSVGQTSVQYTVTNNATASIPNISITLNWRSNGVNLSLSNDNCSNQTLTHGSSCTFNVAISGNNQPSSFTIQPKVCGFNGQLCSQAATTISVNVVQHSLPLRVYEVISPQDVSTEKLVGINIEDTSDIIQTTLSNPRMDGPLAISPDGTKVYMTHQNLDDSYSLLVFDVTETSLTPTEVSYNLSYEDQALGTPGQIAITPDGNTLYITNISYSDTGYPVYRVDLTKPSNTAVTGISDGTTGGVAQNPKGIVVSPDGTTVYLSNTYSTPNNIFSFPNSSTTTNLSTIVRETDLTAINSLLIASDDSTLYASGQSAAENYPAAIEQYNVADDFSLEQTFSPAPTHNGNIISATLSPNNANIYSIVQDQIDDNFLLYSINTTNMTASSVSTYPYHSVFGTYNSNYISYSPDGSAVSILNYGSSGALTALFNPDSPDNVTTVNPAGGILTMYSRTRGSFIN